METLVCNGTYATSDFYLACFLKARGMKIKGLEREGRRSIFIFNDTPNREDLVKQFYNDSYVNNFTHAIQDLKALVFNF